MIFKLEKKVRFSDAPWHNPKPVKRKDGTDVVPPRKQQRGLFTLSGEKAKCSGERLDLVVDNGSAAHAIPREAAAQWPTTQGEAKTYRAASGHPVPNLGQRAPVLQFQNRSQAPVQFEVMDVSRPLLSVSRLVAKGYKVSFDEGDGGSWTQQKSIGKWFRFYERGGVHVLSS